MVGEKVEGRESGVGRRDGVSKATCCTCVCTHVSYSHLA